MKSAGQLLKERNLQPNGESQRFVDSEVLRLCNSKIPFKTGNLARSGIINTKIGSGKVKYSTPYARKIYYSQRFKFTGAPERGAYWFERMKNGGGKEAILDGLAKLTGGDIK